jgi:translation elongation factor EF-1alpha
VVVTRLLHSADKKGKEIEKDPKALINTNYGLVQFEMKKPAYITQFKINSAFGRIILQDNN